MSVLGLTLGFALLGSLGAIAGSAALLLVPEHARVMLFSCWRRRCFGDTATSQSARPIRVPAR